jgi:hypothetical protein
MRGLYGQNEGNESRSTSAVLTERLRDNEICEGEWLAPMQEAAKNGNMKRLARLREDMKTSYVQGGVPAILAQERADSLLRQALIYLRV